MTFAKNCQTFFHQTSMPFHSAMATLEHQNFVVSRTVWTKNIPLISGRLIPDIFKMHIDQFIVYCQILEKAKQKRCSETKLVR